MKSVWICGLAILLGTAVYWLLPSVVCRIDRRLVGARLNALPPPGQKQKRSRRLLLPAQWREKAVLRLRQAGYDSPLALPGYLILQLAPIPVLILLGRLCGAAGKWPVLAGIILVTLINGRISHKIHQRQRSFSRSLFKIYRFLDLQLTAGIKVTDSLRGLPESIQDPVVHPVLLRFAALFELTLDLDKSLAEIRLAFPGPDCDLLATHLRQCLQTGQAGNSLIRMEELLFTRYFNMMQAETAKIRTQLLLTAILGITPGVILFLFPFLAQAYRAVQSVFG
jgi:hypothetical protein